MDGGNLHEGIMEVALEQWVQTAFRRISRIQRLSPVTGKRYRIRSYRTAGTGICPGCPRLRKCIPYRQSAERIL